MKHTLNKHIEWICYSSMLIFLFMGSQYVVLAVMEQLMGSTFVNQHMFLRTFLSYVMILLGLWMLNYVEHYQLSTSYQGFTYQKACKALAYGFPLWLGVNAIILFVQPFFPTYDTQIQTLFTPNEPLLRFVVLVIGAPLIEEYIFREKMQKYIQQRTGKYFAIILQGMLFGAMHPFPMQKIYTTALGIGFGFIRVRVGHLLAPTLLHMVINGIGYINGIG